MDVDTFECVVDGIAFPEGLRWHEGQLWFSDILRDVVMRVTPGHDVEVALRGIPSPSGIGFNDGRVFVVSMDENVLYRSGPNGSVQTFIDMTNLGALRSNDMVIDGGVSYIGFRGPQGTAGASQSDESAVGGILLVENTSGEARIVAQGLAGPNGMVITNDGTLLIVAETNAHRLSAFDRRDDGTLSGRRIFIQFDGGMPDGLCKDAEDGIWVGLIDHEQFVRIDAAGHISDRIAVPDWRTIDCVLGGPDGRTLFLAVAQIGDAEDFVAKRSRGRILACTVDIRDDVSSRSTFDP